MDMGYPPECGQIDSCKNSNQTTRTDLLIPSLLNFEIVHCFLQNLNLQLDNVTRWCKRNCITWSCKLTETKKDVSRIVFEALNIAPDICNSYLCEIVFFRDIHQLKLVEMLIRRFCSFHYDKSFPHRPENNFRRLQCHNIEAIIWRKMSDSDHKLDIIFDCAYFLCWI